jgi:hypothetical protein
MASAMHKERRISVDELPGMQVRGKGLLTVLSGSLSTASEREASINDPTLWCENDTGI